jgi:hypothetical protein
VKDKSPLAVTKGLDRICDSPVFFVVDRRLRFKEGSGGIERLVFVNADFLRGDTVGEPERWRVGSVVAFEGDGGRDELLPKSCGMGEFGGLGISLVFLTE